MYSRDFLEGIMKYGMSQVYWVTSNNYLKIRTGLTAVLPLAFDRDDYSICSKMA
jgi:hypothetical protein